MFAREGDTIRIADVMAEDAASWRRLVVDFVRHARLTGAETAVFVHCAPAHVHQTLVYAGFHCRQAGTSVLVYPGTRGVDLAASPAWYFTEADKDA